MPSERLVQMLPIRIEARRSVDLVGISGVKFSLAGSTRGIELVDQSFKRAYGHVVLIRAEQELARHVRP